MTMLFWRGEKWSGVEWRGEGGSESFVDREWLKKSGEDRDKVLWKGRAARAVGRERAGEREGG